MSIEKILLIGLAIAAMVMFTNFLTKGSDAIGERTNNMTTELNEVENNGLNFSW